jgi:predicted metalloprotease with PDZ domain
MKALCSLFILFFQFFPVFTFAGFTEKPPVIYSINLNDVREDKVKIEVKIPALSKDTLTFFFPEIVPGTYSIYDFGRFISGFEASDNKGAALKFEKAGVNAYRIFGAKKLHAISYWVDDTWDFPSQDNIVFEPAGTNFEPGKNFVLNFFGMIGYFPELKFNPYTIAVSKPRGFYAGTGINKFKTSAQADTFFVDNYVDLVDAPVLYCLPDTAVITLGSTRVLIAVYSETGKVKASQISSDLESLLRAQESYLGGNLPVEKYAFLFYFSAKPTASGGSGALEHCFSSFYVLPEIPYDLLRQMIRDVSAHEFFHIITPLTIHSEEIGDFSFNAPKMSRHLWLYEGCTEYAAGHVQLVSKIIELDQYLEMIRSKIITASRFDSNLSFTKMSLGVLDKYKEQYENVYYKGALIGLMLDILLLDQSDGKYNLRKLMLDLGKEYGINKSFKDEELFAKIESLTSPEIGTFFRNFVEGEQPLPVGPFLEKVGIFYIPGISLRTLSFGGVDLGYEPETGKIIIADISEIDSFGISLGYKEGDELLSFNGQKVNADNIREIISSYMKNAKPGQTLKVVVRRKNEKGKFKKITLKEKVRFIEVEQKHILMTVEELSDRQKLLRDAWMR